MKAANASVVSSLSDETAAIKKAIASPECLHYKGVTLSPPAASWRLKPCGVRAATGGDINTPFTGFRWNTADAAQLSEFFGSGRQSRMALKAVGKLD